MRKALLQLGWQFTVCTFFVAFFIAGCATNNKPTSQYDPISSNAKLNTNQTFYKQGRLSIKVGTETPQLLSGAFEIKGDALQGELSMFSPIGSTVAQVSWTPTQAILIANNETKRFEHINALMQELTGTSLPLNALFDWLAAAPTPADGWEVDLSQMQQAKHPRLFAKRVTPLPAAEIRVVLEP